MKILLDPIVIVLVLLILAELFINWYFKAVDDLYDIIMKKLIKVD